jgi:hypothetical protein
MLDAHQFLPCNCCFQTRLVDLLQLVALVVFSTLWVTVMVRLPPVHRSEQQQEQKHWLTAIAQHLIKFVEDHALPAAAVALEKIMSWVKATTS